MKVVEIFDSMQGEGEYMGVMCTFVRFAGCNLRCPFCDEASKYDKATEMTIEEIVHACRQSIVVLTGGEPTIQSNLLDLIDALQCAGKKVHIETNGTGGIDNDDVWVTCSPKAPEYELTYTGYNEIKLVVSKDLTLKTALEIASHTKKRVWLQPCDGPWLKQSRDTILVWIEKYPDKFRAGIQLHKWYEVI